MFEKRNILMMMLAISIVIPLFFFFAAHTEFGVWKENKIDFFNIVVLLLFFYMSLHFIYDVIIKFHLKTVTKKIVFKDPQKKRYNNIDFLRVIFTLGPIMFHISYYTHTWNGGFLAVDFFFILAGFFFACNIEKYTSISEYMFRRFIRFYPLVICGALLNGLVKEKIRIGAALSDFVFLPAPQFYPTLGLNGVAWFVIMLFWVSIVYFYIQKKFSFDTRNLLIGLIVFISYSLCANFGWHRVNRIANDGVGYIINGFVLRAFAGLGLGYFLYIIYNMRQLHKKIFSPYIYTILEFVFLFISLGCMHSLFLVYDETFNIYFIISFFILILLFLEKNGFISRLFDLDIWAYMGRYTLAIYLCQSISVEFLFPFFMKSYSMNKSIVLMLICSILIGIWAYHVIQKPIEEKLKKKIL